MTTKAMRLYRPMSRFQDDNGSQLTAMTSCVEEITRFGLQMAQAVRGVLHFLVVGGGDLDGSVGVWSNQ